MMSFKASFMLLLSALAFLPSNATESPAELYWKTKLGNIPMPKVLKDSLQLDARGGKVNYAHPSDQDAQGAMAYARPTDLDTRGAYARPTDLDTRGAYARPTLDNHQDGQNHYAYSVPQDGQVIYFTDGKLFIAGTKMKLHFRKIDDGVKFLPLHVAKSIAIAPNKLQMILNVLSVNLKSTAAQYIEKTIKDCEETGVKDEVRFCATSLESMVDNITLNLTPGKNKLMVVSTEQEQDILMEYKIQKSEKLGKEDNQTTVCHKLENPYAVFLCHSIRSTDVYGVSLVGANGKQMKAIAVCHKDTLSGIQNI